MADEWSDPKPDAAQPEASDADAPPGEQGKPPKAAPSEEDLIARNLRTLFDTYQTEPMPDRLRDLLSRLAEEEGRDKE